MLRRTEVFQGISVKGRAVVEVCIGNVREHNIFNYVDTGKEKDKTVKEVQNRRRTIM